MASNGAGISAGQYRGPARGARTLLTAALLGFAFQTCSATSTVTVDYRVFPGLAEMDGNWAALLAASDGKVYAGLGLPRLQRTSCLLRLEEGHDDRRGRPEQADWRAGLEIGPQSKIHAKFGEGKDGRIYFATHGGWWFDYARFATPEGYPGSHYMAYDPRLGQVQDFGPGPRFEGMNTGAYDPKFNRIYGLTHPRGHFVYYDVATGAKVDKGRVNKLGLICRTLGVDDQGNVYGSYGAGRIFMYSPRNRHPQRTERTTAHSPEGHIPGARLRKVGDSLACGGLGRNDQEVLWRGGE